MPRSAERVVVLLAFWMLMAAPLPAARVRQVNVPAGHSTAHDLTRFDEKVSIAGELNGDVQLIGGELLIDGIVRGDVATLGTEITFGPAGRVEGDVVSLGGRLNHLRTGAVSGQLVTRGSEQTDSSELTLGSLGQLTRLSVALNLLLLGGWLLATIIGALSGGRALRASSLELRASPLHTFALGLVAFTSFILTLVFFSFLIPFGIGVPLIVIAASLAVAAKIYGMISVFHAVGSRLFGPRTHDDARGGRLLRGDLLLAVAGLLVLGLVRLIPLIGPFVWMIASIFGVGAALATRFGRREPWFLAVRQVSY